MSENLTLGDRLRASDLVAEVRHIVTMRAQGEWDYRSLAKRCGRTAYGQIVRVFP